MKWKYLVLNIVPQSDSLPSAHLWFWGTVAIVIKTNHCPTELNFAPQRFMALRDSVNIFSSKYCSSERHSADPRFMVLRDNVNIFSAKHCASRLSLAVPSNRYCPLVGTNLREFNSSYKYWAHILFDSYSDILQKVSYLVEPFFILRGFER